MKEKLPDSNWKTMKIVFIFLFVVIILISASLLIRAVSVYSQSSFDGTHRFVLEVIDPDKKIILISLEPLSEQVSIVTLIGSYHVSDIEHLPFFIDAKLYLRQKKDSHLSPHSIAGMLIFKHASYANMTILDLLRICLAVYFMPKSGVSEQIVSLPLHDTPEQVFKKSFIDSEIIQEDATYAIVNATGVSGLAGKLEQVFSLMGGRVVSVTTARDEEDKTQITYSGQKTYAVSRIERMFQKQADQGNKSGVSDILIVLGKESLKNKLFQ